MINQFLIWYLVVQLIGVAAAPLAWRFFGALPDRGYAFARPLGILLTAFLFWAGYSYGLLRNEPGGAWLAFFIMAAVSLAVGRGLFRKGLVARYARDNWGYVLSVELLFLIAFAAWAWVRANDPAANHTEKPMDLMFMNSIRNSVTYPPMDAWLAGNPISYYYFGYWMLAMLGQLTGLASEIAYNLGQASWFGLLLTGSFGVVYNLLRIDHRRLRVALVGGLLAAIMVGVAANWQGIFEWAYANGLPVGRVAALFQVPGFPEEAAVTNRWHVDYGWWWWRSSRVIEDLDLAGNHIEVIDEFPAFSYILGDNHPHVLAMPFALLAVALALTLFRQSGARKLRGQHSRPSSHDVVVDPPEGNEELPHESQPRDEGPAERWWQALYGVMPLGWFGWILTAVVTGSLVFLNTWDYPPYWLLTVAALFVGLVRRNQGDGRHGRVWQAAVMALAGGLFLALAGIVLYLPYFLTAQSQAGGFVPNLFNPTKLGQFVVMFGTALLAIVALILWTWPAARPRLSQILISLAVVLGLPLLFLIVAAFIATATPAGEELLRRLPLPESSAGYLSHIMVRWVTQPFTFVLAGSLLAIVVSLLWRRLGEGINGRFPDWRGSASFALLLAGIGLALVYAPEFVFLRDNFGTRMNTIFKFYYQAWMLFGLAGAYTIVVTLSKPRGRGLVAAVFSGVAVVLVAASTIYMIAGAYSKTGGFASVAPTFDATAYLVMGSGDELSAVRWVHANTLPSDLVLEGKGSSYRADTNRISTMTGRPTLLGWDGHESQWRGKAYGEMAAGRPQALTLIYRDASEQELRELLDTWGIDYVYVGPLERSQYGVTPLSEFRFDRTMDLVFESGDVRIYRTR